MPSTPRRLLQEDASHILLEALPDALLIVNGDGHIVLANSQAEKLFGYEHDAALGTRLIYWSRAISRINVVHRGNYRKNPYTWRRSALELFARHKDGRDFPVEISLSPLQSKEGALVVATIRDIQVQASRPSCARWRPATGAR